VRRVSVIGCSGSGKTTLARALAGRLGVPHLELDGVFHQAGWVPLDRGQFQSRVAERLGAPGWVVDGNYVGQGVASLVWARADTIVWLDLPRYAVMAQLVARTLRRVVTREELWNGNRERWQNFVARRPEENLMLWAWTRHGPQRQRYARMMQDGTWAGREVFRLRSRRDVEAFLRGLAVAAAPG